MLRLSIQLWAFAFLGWADLGLWKSITELYSPSIQRWVKVIFMSLRSDIPVNRTENWQVDPNTCGNSVYDRGGISKLWGKDTWPFGKK